MVLRNMFFLCLLGFNLYTCAITPPPANGFRPDMSEEELLNQLMEEINAALPEDQREAFWQEVARETERLERETAHMNPEEKERYLFGLMTEDAAQSQEPKKQSDTQPRPLVKEEEKPKPRQTVPLAKTEELIQIVSQITKSIESFLSKAAAFPDFDGKAVRWTQQGRITDWKAASWSAFQHDLSKLVNLLQRFKEKDIKIGFKHLEALAAKEATVANLKQLQQKLSDYEPTIKLNSFEIASMSDQTKTAAVNTINALTETLYRTQLAQDLQKILEEFDPTAKKIREEEEKAYASAFEQSKKGPTRVELRSGKSQKDALALPSFDDLGLTRRPTPRIADTSRQAPADRKAPESKKGGGGQKSGGAAGGSAAKGGAKPGAKGGDKKPGGPQAGKPDEAKKPSAQLQHAEIKRNIEAGFTRDIEEAYNVVSETPEFQSTNKLKEYLQATPAT